MASLQEPPRWKQSASASTSSSVPRLSIYNSLTRRKDTFEPINPDGEIGWYACGPTVYDDAHLGHARNYVSTDIIRRILRDHFGYRVKFVMNITDVDDKIILRARQQHLLSQFRSKNSQNADVSRETALLALRAYLGDNLPLIPSDTSPQGIAKAVDRHYGHIVKGGGGPNEHVPDGDAKVRMHASTVIKASKVMAPSPSDEWQSDVFYSGAEDLLVPYLDSQQGSTIDVSDHSIFTKLAKTYEERFFKDMQDLNVLYPDEVTRVTDYGPQIISFVEKIQSNGFAYPTSDGSVYFDIDSFEAANNRYARLEPSNRNNKDLQADGEGALSKKTADKRSAADFALWKSSKPGEPTWDSPWGKGRPGWHIECSAMASDKLGSRMDIHSGGIDLAFPHHDNELAQSEAYWGDKGGEHQHQWVNYFMHMGHLHIQGSKMSKSLKNFTTIQQALQRGGWTPRGLRIVFLLGGWKEGIEISEDMIKAGSAWEDKVDNYFFNVIDLLDASSGREPQGQAVGEAGTAKATDALEAAIKDTDTALADSFDTPRAMAAISMLITELNRLDKSRPGLSAVREAATWVTKMLNIFGLNGHAGTDSRTIGWSGVSIADEAKPFVYPLSRFRDGLRQKATTSSGLSPEDLRPPSAFDVAGAADGGREENPYARAMHEFAEQVRARSSGPAAGNDLKKEVLLLCDRLRDQRLWELGVYLEDRDGQAALVRPVTRALREAREEKARREAQKRDARRKLEQDAAARAERGRQDPATMYRTAEYGAWREDGIPVKDAAGSEVSESRKKKLKKDQERQERLHRKWLEEEEEKEKEKEKEKKKKKNV